MISIIVAVAENNAIGKNNELLWHLPEDLKKFKSLTSGHRIIMGRNTFLSLPKRPLPNRTSIVITDIPDEVFEGCIMVHSVEEAISLCPEDEESFVIGGGSIYRQFMAYATKLYYTKVHAVFEADTFFPKVEPGLWDLISEEKHLKDEANPVGYSFLVYEKRK